MAELLEYLYTDNDSLSSTTKEMLQIAFKSISSTKTSTVFQRIQECVNSSSIPPATLAKDLLQV
jgi:hypothetical protein